MSEPDRVLVADDDFYIRHVLDRFLSERGYAVTTAADGEEVMRLLRGDPPDIILLDIDMPKLSGLEVLRRIQSESIDVGVIIISGHPDEEVAKKSLTMGAADFIVKPFDFAYLETSLMAKLLTLGSDRP